MRHSIVFLTCLFSLNSFSQNKILTFQEIDSLKGWSGEGNITLNFSNVGLSNWAGGGESALSLASELAYQLTFENEKALFENKVEVELGTVRNDKVKEFRKTDDQFKIQFLYGRKLSNHSFTDLSTSITTQLLNGFNYKNEPVEKISTFLSPGLWNMALGITLFKEKVFSTKFSPLSGKMTIVLDDVLASMGSFGLEEGEQSRFEGGASIKNKVAVQFMENVDFNLDAYFFSNYEDPKAIDVNVRSSLKMKVNSSIQSSISATLIYDEDIDVERDDGTNGPALQFKNVINVGLSMKI